MAFRLFFISVLSLAAVIAPLTAVRAQTTHETVTTNAPRVSLSAERVLLPSGRPLSDAARFWLLTYGEPLWSEVNASEGETIEQVVDRLCGPQPTEIRETLVKRGLKLNYLKTTNDRMRKGFVAFVPYCMKNFQIERNNSVLASTADQQPAVSQPPFKLNARFNQNTASAHSDAQTITELNRIFESASTIPESGSAAPVEIGYNFMSTSAQDGGFLTDARCAMAPTREGTLFNTYDRQKFVDFFDAQYEIFQKLRDEAHSGNTRVTVGLIDSGINGVVTGKTVEKLADEKWFLEKYFYKRNVKLAKPFVGLDYFGRNLSVDYKKNETASCLKSRKPNASEADKKCYIDEDDTVQFFHETGENSPHGTKMASLLLGGPGQFGTTAIVSNNIAINDHISLRIVNFADRNAARITLGESALTKAIQYFNGFNTRVINMSLDAEGANIPTGESVPTSLEAEIENMPETLFVSAAGNKNKLITEAPSDPDGSADYVIPASFRNKIDTNNLIVVSSFDRDEQGPLASDHIMANWGRNFVDFFAPGDCINVVGFELRNIGTDYEASGKTGGLRDAQKLKPMRESGTSVAAAVTSYFAALTRRLMDETSISSRPEGVDPEQYITSQLSARLIGGLDYDEKLEGLAEWPGRLNPLKSINVYTDVIELNNQASDQAARLKRVLLGERARKNTLQWCDDDRERLQSLNTIRAEDGGRIIKVIPNIRDENSEEKFVAFWVLSEHVNGVQSVKSIRCKQIQDDTRSIGAYQDVESGYSEKEDLTLEDIVDITFATEPTSQLDTLN